MFLYLHPTRHEALTASETALTRWSLATTPATVLAQVSTAPGVVFTHLYDPGGRLLSSGGVALVLTQKNVEGKLERVAL
ncbi:MAG TPA: hypothetical protein VKY19_04325 [Ktedonosporobacter sp.]|jgi:hypothetical protein|nr:hypothetical protein [Ktedonosporobacter sp.]